jgi:FeS assembly SUF system protein
MSLKEQIIKALKTVYDPEVPVNIYDMGLIYDLSVNEAGIVAVSMTLTAPNCPVAGSLPGDAERAIRAVPGVTDAKVELTFDPPWSKDRMSDVAKLMLGMEDIEPSPLLKVRR